MTERDTPERAGASRQEECVWCLAGEERFTGCCDRERPHHHTRVQGRDGVRIIPNDDCAAPPAPPVEPPRCPPHTPVKAWCKDEWEWVCGHCLVALHAKDIALEQLNVESVLSLVNAAAYCLKPTGDTDRPDLERADGYLLRAASLLMREPPREATLMPQRAAFAPLAVHEAQEWRCESVTTGHRCARSKDHIGEHKATTENAVISWGANWPAPETPPRPEARIPLGERFPAVKAEMVAAIRRSERYPAQPNAESAAGQAASVFVEAVLNDLFTTANLCRPKRQEAREALLEHTTPLLAEAKALRERCEALADLLRRIRGWDHMDVAGDGAFWRREIDAALSGGGGPSK